MPRDREPPHGNGAPPPPPPPPAPEHHGKPKRKKRHLFRKLVIILILVLLILIVLYLWKGPGLGGGPGSGASQSPASSSTAPSAAETEPASNPDDGNAKVIIVRIDGETVSVDGTVVADAEALKQAVLDLYTDGTVFRLEDHDSILATYDWVTQAFQDMSITLVEEQ